MVEDQDMHALYGWGQSNIAENNIAVSAQNKI